MSAAGAIGEAVVAGIGALLELTRSEDAATAEEARRQVERARGAVAALPVREAEGTWDADERERLARGTPSNVDEIYAEARALARGTPSNVDEIYAEARALATRPPEPPANPFEGE